MTCKQCSAHSGYSGVAWSPFTKQPPYLPWPFLDALHEQEQEMLEVSLRQQAKPHIKACAAEQLYQMQEVCICVGPRAR